MNKTIKTIIAGTMIAGGLFSSASLLAAQESNALMITPFGGKFIFAHKRNLDNTGFQGLNLGYSLDDHMSAEVSLANLYTESNASYNHGENVRGRLYLIDLDYRFMTCCKLQPFVIGGVGDLNLNPSGAVDANNPNGVDSANQMNVNLGGGLQYFPEKWLAFRAQVMDLYTFSGGGKNDIAATLGLSVYL